MFKIHNSIDNHPLSEEVKNSLDTILEDEKKFLNRILNQYKSLTTKQIPESFVFFFFFLSWKKLFRK